MKKLLAGIAVLSLVSSTIEAQSSLPINANITILSPVALSKVSDLMFGTVVGSVGVVTCSTCTPGRWAGQGAAGRTVNISFQLPSVLTRVGNSATVPISFGSESGLITPNIGTAARFNPGAGIMEYTLTGDGTFDVALGVSPGSAAQDITVNVSTAPPGVYTGVITLTLFQN